MTVYYKLLSYGSPWKLFNNLMFSSSSIIYTNIHAQICILKLNSTEMRGNLNFKDTKLIKLLLVGIRYRFPILAD